MSGINKVVLAYSGGLDTSVIAKWLTETYDCEVVTFTADLGQGGEVEPARAKAEALMNRWGHPDDVAKAVVYLADPNNTFVTGETINVNGGWDRTHRRSRRD